MEKSSRRKIAGLIVVRSLPSAKTILRLYDFEPETGVFLHKKISREWSWADDYNARIAGTPAGHTTSSGYVRLKILGQSCAAHRLVWKVVNGSDPVGLIDHINGIRDDNRIENLRDVTPAQNAANAIRSRWANEKVKREEIKAREAVERAKQRAIEIEHRERATLTRLKAKYES